MAEYRYSQLAESDADDITAFSIKTWDAAQADRYIGGLEAHCQRLADGHVATGRPCEDISPGLFRDEYVSHVVFYRPKPYGVRIVRILHYRQLPQLHDFEEEDFNEDE